LTDDSEKFPEILRDMILIADSGSTKTSWSLVNTRNGSLETCHTSGINPMYQDEETIYKLLQKEFTLIIPDQITLYFYGAGCINHQVNETVNHALIRYFHPAGSFVDTDLMAAARSLCQRSKGIACILGTGSNSCYYDGHEIIRHISPLGYMLGDEGSGAVIGRKFIADLLKNQLPGDIRERFFRTYALTPHQIMEQVYKKPFPNRFLAQFTLFVHNNLQDRAVSNLVKNSFDEFFARNIRQYPEALQMPVHFTGSIAFHFESLLRESALNSGFEIGIITGSPMEGLIRYHLHQ
jgi:glucosamine kinase